MKRKFVVLAIEMLMVLVPAVVTAAMGAGRNTTHAYTAGYQTLLSDTAFLPLIFNQALGDSSAFLETFSGTPSNPQPWQPSHWDVTVHSRNWNYTDTLTPMHADHGTACDAPPANHLVNTFEASVFLCRDHMMTGILDGGYGVIYLTPDAMVDFSSGTAVIRFDVSTQRNSGRDWIDVWVTPYEDNLQLPLDSWLPDLNGPPRRAIHIRMDFVRTNTTYRADVISDFDPDSVGQVGWQGYETFLTPSATRRDTFELRISQDHIEFGMPEYDFWWIDHDIPNLDWSQGVVQFGHHSYDPEKDCGYNGTCGPSTWHWDNVLISPAVDFTIIRANQRYVNAGTGPSVSLAVPAPAGAHLRFAGIGHSLEVSFDGGGSWEPAQVQDQLHHFEDHFQSYWMPIPAGVSQVRFRGQGWYGGGWQVRDISVWAPPSTAASQQ